MLTDARAKAVYESLIQRRGIRVCATRVDPHSGKECKIPVSPFNAIVYPSTERPRPDDLFPGTTTERYLVVSTPREVSLKINDTVKFPAGRVAIVATRGTVSDIRDNQLGWDYIVKIGTDDLSL